MAIGSNRAAKDLRHLSLEALAVDEATTRKRKKDSCSRGGISKRTRAGVQEKVKQSVAFPPCLQLLPPFWRGLIVQYDRSIPRKIELFERATCSLLSVKPLFPPCMTAVLKFSDFTRFLDVYIPSIVINTHAIVINTTKLKFDGLRGFVRIPLGFRLIPLGN